MKKPGRGYIKLDQVWEALAHKSVSLDTFHARVSKNHTLKDALTKPSTLKDKEKEGRRSITAALTQAASGYLLKKGYAVFRELAVQPWGNRRADVVGITLGGYIIIVEVKSCRADLTADKKYQQYLPHCNRMYVAFPHTMTVPKELSAKLKADGIGIMKLGANGLVNVSQRAKHRTMDPVAKEQLTMRMLWRSAVVSKRTSRRTRVYLEPK